MASQLHDRLSSQAFPGIDDQDSDNAPDNAPDADALEPTAPLHSPAVPEQLPLEISPSLSPLVS